MSKSNISLKRNSSFVCTAETLKKLSLQSYCSSKSYQIALITPLTLKDFDLCHKIVKEGKKYENFSSVHFVNYQDVLDLLNRLIHEDNCDLPKKIIECAQKIVAEKIDQLDCLSLEFIALLTKLRIIESMYEKYRNEVNNMQMRQRIHEELTNLLYDCERSEEREDKKKKAEKHKGKNVNSRTKFDKSKRGVDKKVNKSTKGDDQKSKRPINKPSKRVLEDSNKTDVKIDDYTEITLEDNDLILDLNIDNHFMYVVLSGFSDPLLIQELARMSVEVSVVIDVALRSSDSDERVDFISKLEKAFQTPKSFSHLENTAWLRYRSNGHSSSKQTVEEFFYVLKRINYIKRLHLSYIKDLALFVFQDPPRKLNAECSRVYTSIMNSYPCELVNVALIVRAMVEEICWTNAGLTIPLSDTTSSSECERKVENEYKSFQVHEEDVLKMGIKTYKEIGQQCYFQTLECLNLLRPLNRLQTSNETEYTNRAVSTSDSCHCDNTAEIFDCLHLAIFTQMVTKEFTPKEHEDCELTENMVTQDRTKEYCIVVPKRKKKDEITTNSDFVFDYHMKEDLSSAVLRQMIFKAMTDYHSWDRKFCNESNSILLRFHDNLDSCGLNTRIWYERLRTPVCLRDFCRFVANEDKEWLEEFALTELNEENFEDCEGLQDIHLSELYHKYQDILGVSNGDSIGEKKKIFEEMLNELLSYPKSDMLNSYCSGSRTLVAYDLGPKICQLTGHTTIFRSDDDVKVNVDTSRFLTDDRRCSIIIDSAGNSLIFHENRSSNFHFILKDDTIINFSKNRLNDVEREVKENPYEDVKIEEEYYTEDVKIEEELDIEDKPEMDNYNSYWIQILRKNKITNVFTKTPASIFDRKIEVDDKNLDMLLKLFKAAISMPHAIYKISTRPSLHYLRRKASPLYLPLVGTLKRILFKPVRKKRPIVGYNILRADACRKRETLKYDFQITLPNGLMLSSLTRNQRTREIKQEYKYSRHKEKYRIFYSTGVVVIKNVDGSTTILRSNGDIIKLHHRSKCHNSTHIFKGEEETCHYESSRCVDDSNRLKTSTDFVNLYEFGDIPYSKKNLLDFSGKSTDVSKKTVRKKQQYYVITEYDYHTGEVFYGREDGMKCVVYKNGQRVFQFPDGTRVTSWPTIEKELIRVSGSLNVEGWVSVVVNYKYEHRDYLTVLYDQLQGATEVFLKDGVVKVNRDSCVMNVYNTVSLEVTSASVVLVKTCETCDSDCICRIHTDGIPKLLEVCDSYNKYFSSDSSGQCEINLNFATGRTNKNGCDHVRKNEKQKFFVVNGDGLFGSILWKDEQIENKISNDRNSKNVKVVNYLNQLTQKHTIEFFTEISQNFIGRFTMTNSYEDEICLSKYKQTSAEKPRVFYVTFRILTELQNLFQHKNNLTNLEDFLERRVGNSELLEGMKFLLRYISTHQEEVRSYRADMQEVYSEVSKSASRSRDSNDISVHCVLEKWRQKCNHYRLLIKNKIFPPYFNSVYYLRTYQNK